MNIAVVEGILSSPPRQRTLPSGSRLWIYEVTTGEAGERRGVPVVWLDPSRPARLGTGDSVVAVGSVRRRFFRGGGGVASRTELDAEVVAASGSERARRAIDAARSRIAGP